MLTNVYSFPLTHKNNSRVDRIILIFRAANGGTQLNDCAHATNTSQSSSSTAGQSGPGFTDSKLSGSLGKQDLRFQQLRSA